MSDWQCEACTYINPSEADKCTICESAKPVAVVPQKPPVNRSPKPQHQTNLSKLQRSLTILSECFKAVDAPLEQAMQIMNQRAALEKQVQQQWTLFDATYIKLQNNINEYFRESAKVYKVLFQKANSIESSEKKVKSISRSKLTLM
jgi:septal ring factor EnvC (AmiA/AmiB activator)